MKLSTAFHTKWAKVWAENVKEFTETNETLSYTNVRATICEAQREFERHLSEVMNHQPHQQLF
jgi:hypothetical protein